MRFGLRRAHRNRADYVTLSPYAPPAVAPRGPARPDLPGIAGEILAKAEAAIDRLAAEYPEHARRDIADMENYATHMARDRNNRAAHYQEILRIAHDVRGQGALFGYFEGKPLPAWAREFDCVNWAQFFLKFIVSHPAVTCAIPATSRVDHMHENMGAAVGRLPDAETRGRMIRYVESL